MSEPLVTVGRALRVSLAAGVAMLVAAWAWDQLRQYLATQGFILHDLLFMGGLLVVMFGTMQLVAGRMLKDLRAQAQLRSQGK